MAYNSALSVGTVLHAPERDYIVLKVLGQGGFGITYLVEGNVCVGNIEVSVQFAVKEHFISSLCVRGENSKTVETFAHNTDVVNGSKKAFIKEAQRVQSLGINHPNIVRINEVFEANNTAYYVMEYLQGESLAGYINRKGALSERETTELLLPVIHAVATMHGKDLAHYDIKPDNIVLAKEKNGNLRPTLIDFGLAKHYDGQGQATSTTQSSGYSPGYSPIEQYGGIHQFSPQSDVYAIAATIYHCLVGRVPVEAPALDVDRIMEDLQGKASTRLQSALAKAFSAKTISRQANAGEFYNEITNSEIVHQDKSSVKEDKPKTPQEPKTPIKKTVAVGREPQYDFGDNETKPVSDISERKKKWKKIFKIAGVAAMVIGVIIAIGVAINSYVPEADVSSATGTKSGYGYVDLGLPSGLKWATCNVGASSPSNYGNYYAWGETSTKSDYSYDSSVTYGKEIGDISGDPQYDAARANWGDSWRMPTQNEIQELIDNCTWTWSTSKGINGYEVKGPNGNTIFLPAAGYRDGTSLYSAGEWGYYWSSTPYSGSDGAYYLYFGSSNRGVDWYDRYYGFSVRPVSE